MASPAFDLAVGVSSGSLDAGLKQLHAGHRGLLKGDHTEVVSGTRYSVRWDLLEPPRIALGAPDAARWKDTWKQKGVSALPSSGVVQLVMPKLWISLGPEGCTPKELSCSVAVPAHVHAADGKVAVEPLGVWMQTPPADGNDRVLLRRGLVPRLLELGGDLLKGLRLPAQQVFGTTVDFTPVLVDVTERYLVVATSSQPVPAEAPAIGWPADKEVFCLVSPALVKTLVSAAAKHEAARRKPLVDLKETLPNGAESTLEAHFRGLEDLSVDAEDPTRLSAGVKIAWKCVVRLFDSDDDCALVKASQNM